ncbi:hypothetical protein BOX15_Mlig012969g1, partial [Macrostomum lignano]
PVIAPNPHSPTSRQSAPRPHLRSLLAILCVSGVSFLLALSSHQSAVSSSSVMTSTASEPSEASMGQCSLPGDSRKPSIFTKIIRREVPAKILYEDEMVISFLGLPQNRVTPVQFLVVPKKQLATLEEAHSCDEAALGRMFTVASLVAKQQGVTNGYRLVINNGNDSGQEVPHLHIHVFALNAQKIKKLRKSVLSTCKKFAVF